MRDELFKKQAFSHIPLEQNSLAFLNGMFFSARINKTGQKEWFESNSTLPIRSVSPTEFENSNLKIFFWIWKDSRIVIPISSLSFAGMCLGPLEKKKGIQHQRRPPKKSLS